MHIAFISQYFFPEQFSNNNIARWLSERGHKVEVICGVPNYPAGKFFEGYSNRNKRTEIWHDIRIHRARTVPRGSGKLGLVLNYFVFPAAASLLMERKLTARPDVSFVSMPSPLLQALVGVYLKFRKQTPTVYWVQDLWPESALYTLNLQNALITRPLTWLCGWLYRQADLILVQSEAFPPMLERLGVAPEKIRFFPNTAPENYEPKPAESNDRIGRMIPDQRFKLMFAGNIGESQDFDTYLAAAEHLEKTGDTVDWVIIGSGRDEARVRAEINKRGLERIFHFLGRHPEVDMPYFFSHADAMLVGLKDNPIFRLTVPYKVQCYMACGKPLIASLSGEGARVVEESGAGITVPAQSPENLAKAIRKMVRMTSEERAKLGQAGREYFLQTYSADKNYSNLENWLSEAAKQEPDTAVS